MYQCLSDLPRLGWGIEANQTNMRDPLFFQQQGTRNLNVITVENSYFAIGVLRILRKDSRWSSRMKEQRSGVERRSICDVTISSFTALACISMLLTGKLIVIFILLTGKLISSLCY